VYTLEILEKHRRSAIYRLHILQCTAPKLK